MVCVCFYLLLSTYPIWRPKPTGSSNCRLELQRTNYFDYQLVDFYCNFARTNLKDATLGSGYCDFFIFFFTIIIMSLIFRRLFFRWGMIHTWCSSLWQQDGTCETQLKIKSSSCVHLEKKSIAHWCVFNSLWTSMEIQSTNTEWQASFCTWNTWWKDNLNHHAATFHDLVNKWPNHLIWLLTTYYEIPKENISTR